MTHRQEKFHISFYLFTLSNKGFDYLYLQ